MAIAGRAVAGEWAQWNTGEGHNGHAYRAISIPSGITWSNAAASAEATGGYLASIESAEENAFVYALASASEYWNGSVGPWIGGFQTNKSSEASGGWSWISGAPWGYTAWASGQPDNYQNVEDYLHYYGGPTWNDMRNDNTATPIRGYIIEHEAPRFVATEFGSDEPLSLSISHLIIGSTSVLWRTDSLIPALWTNETSFKATSAHTNLPVRANGPQHFYRLGIE
jgi:hypothetical protein